MFYMMNTGNPSVLPCQKACSKKFVRETIFSEEAYGIPLGTTTSHDCCYLKPFKVNAKCSMHYKAWNGSLLPHSMQTPSWGPPLRIWLPKQIICCVLSYINFLSCHQQLRKWQSAKAAQRILKVIYSLTAFTECLIYKTAGYFPIFWYLPHSKMQDLRQRLNRIK